MARHGIEVTRGKRRWGRKSRKLKIFKVFLFHLTNIRVPLLLGLSKMIIDRYNDSKTHPIRYLKFCGIVPADGSNPGPG